MIYDLTKTKEEVQKINTWLADEYKSISTGRATPAVLDSISIESYGSYTAIAQAASISIEDPRTLRVSPWDKTLLKPIEKAINEANLGLSVATDEAGIRVYFPQLTTETRSKLVKILKERLEEARVRVRSLRESTNKDIEEKEKEGGMGEDDKKKIKEEVQKIVDEANASLEVIFSKKEEDTMSI